MHKIVHRPLWLPDCQNAWQGVGYLDGWLPRQSLLPYGQANLRSPVDVSNEHDAYRADSSLAALES